MKLELRIEQKDIDAATRLVEVMQSDWVVQERLTINSQHSAPEADDEKLWHDIMVCLLTSQQRSDDDSPINSVLKAKPFPLALEMLHANPQAAVLRVLQDARGIRFPEKISKNAAFNLEQLEKGEWKNLRQWEAKLRVQQKLEPKPEHYALEREAARYMDRTFKGFGPKQSRNFWQMLGLTRYEFVLDSRFMNWLRSLDTSFVIPGSALADADFYEWLSDILREELCVPAKILPCVLDGAVFSRGNKGKKM